MSKTLGATCDASGKVTAESTEVSVAQVLSEGKQASAGILIIDKDKAWYLCSNATDIKSTIESLIEAIETIASSITKISTTLTSIGAGMTGPTTAPPPTLATDVAELTMKVTELNATKSDLESLMEALK